MDRWLDGPPKRDSKQNKRTIWSNLIGKNGQIGHNLCMRSEQTSLQRFIELANRHPRLSKQDELALARRWREHGERDAALKLVECSIRYLPRLAKRFVGYGIPMSDLVSEGSVGLMKAVDKFDPNKGFRFMSYATYWVRAQLFFMVQKQWSVVGRGTSPKQSKMFFGLRKERARLEQNRVVGEDVTKQLAEIFGTTSDDVQSFLNWRGGGDFALDAPIGEGGGASHGDMLRSGFESPESGAESTLVQEKITQAISSIKGGLNDREMRLMEEHYVNERSLASLGREFGVSRERVRQISISLQAKLARVLKPLVNEMANG